MLHRFLVSALALFIFSGVLLALDGTIISYNRTSLKLIVKVGDKSRTIDLKKTIHVHDADGKEVSVKDRPMKLKKDVKLDIEEENGKVVEINIKK